MDSIAGIEWDDGNWPKCGKHGVTREEIEAMLGGPITIFDDPDHSGAEIRLKAIGRNAEGRAVFVAFTVRERCGLRYIRPVSARYMHESEAQNYGTERP